MRKVSDKKVNHGFLLQLRGKADDDDRKKCSKDCAFLIDISCGLFGSLECEFNPPPLRCSRHENCLKMGLWIND